MKPSLDAELWLDTAAITLTFTAKRAIQVGTAVFEDDIVDVTAMNFPDIEFGKDDKVVYFLREGWRFGLAFDLRGNGGFDRQSFSYLLGTIFRKLKYKDIYDTIEEQSLFEKILETGWFPFAEIINSEFRLLRPAFLTSNDLAEVEEVVLSKFDDSRMRHILERWAQKPHFAEKYNILEAAIAAFCRKDTISTIKILITEIEGILNNAYYATYGQRTRKINVLSEFIELSAKRKIRGENTLLFPGVFLAYLERNTFSNFNVNDAPGLANSRHAVGHGAANQSSYTMVRALQTILILDQIAFYT